MIKKVHRENIVFIILIFLLSIFFLHNIVSTSKIMENIHYINDVTFISQNLKESLFEYGQLHLWTPYYYSGRPLYAQPEYYFLDFSFLYLLLFRNIFIAMNLATLTYFFLSGLGMYLLFLTFKDNKKGAFIAAIIYMFNSYMHSFVMTGNLNVLAGYSLIPFAFMFFVKALKSKNFTKNSVFSGLLITLQIFSGGTLFMTYEIVLFGIYALFYLFGGKLRSRLLKVIIVSLIVILVGVGLSAIKLLPGIEFLNLSNRGTGISYQEYLGNPIELNNLVHVLVTNLFTSTGLSASIGIMGFLLLIFSLYGYKKRYVLFSLFIIIVSVLMAVKGPVSDLFFKIPVFNQLRHIERAIFLSAFASSILAGTGFLIFSEKVKKLIKINKNFIIFSVVVLLILLETLFLQAFPLSTEIVNPKEIDIIEFMGKDPDTFRTISLGLSTLVGPSGYNYLSQVGIGTIKGGSGIWFNDYLMYLSFARQTKPAKLWGLLNNKYVISDNELNISGLKFVKKFKGCDGCDIWEVYGPYLYENLEFMPRAFYVDKGILVIGAKKNVEQIIYPLILNDNFNPRETVIIHGQKSIQNYNLGELEKYDAIILSEAISNNELSILRSYADNGGILLPDIFSDKNSITEQEIGDLFKLLEGNFEDIESIEYENNKAVYNVNGKKGFLVLSERFSNFPGWDAYGKNKKEVLKANGIITAVSIDNDDKITFKYEPHSFRKGMLISLLTLSLIIIYFGYSKIKNHEKNRT